MTPPASAPGNPAAPGGAGDPSMEDILASIRRILSEDEAEPSPLPAPPHEEAPPAPGPDVLALDASMLVEPLSPALPARETAHSVEPPPPPPPQPAAPAPSLQAPEPAPVSEPPTGAPQPLIGAAASAAAASSVGALLRTLSTERQQVPVYRGGPSIEDVVREEIRSLLKVWLDANLPPLVERLVRAEIERLVGGAMS